MFPGHSPRRQSSAYLAGYPGYQQAHPGYELQGGYGMYGVEQQPGWPHPGMYNHTLGQIYTNRSYEDWSHHSGFSGHGQPPSPTPPAHPASSSETEEPPVSSSITNTYTSQFKATPISNVQDFKDFKPPIFPGDGRISVDDRPDDPLSLRRPPQAGGLDHHSPDSGVSASDGVSSSGSPIEGHLGAAPPPGSPHDVILPQRPLPARSPFEWMKRPNFSSRPSKEGLSDGKTRTKDKYRVVYSDHQRLELEKEFHYSRYITIRRKAELAQALTLTERQVKIWFQNRRAKERKHMKKRDEILHKDKMDVAGLAVHPMAAMSGFPMGPVGHMLHHPVTAHSHNLSQLSHL